MQHSITFRQGVFNELVLGFLYWNEKVEAKVKTTSLLDGFIKNPI